jgi:hypothetical protein
VIDVLNVVDGLTVVDTEFVNVTAAGFDDTVTDSVGDVTDVLALSVLPELGELAELSELPEGLALLEASELAEALEPPWASTPESGAESTLVLSITGSASLASTLASSSASTAASRPASRPPSIAGVMTEPLRELLSELVLTLLSGPPPELPCEPLMVVASLPRMVVSLPLMNVSLLVGPSGIMSAFSFVFVCENELVFDCPYIGDSLVVTPVVVLSATDCVSVDIVPVASEVWIVRTGGAVRTIVIKGTSAIRGLKRPGAFSGSNPKVTTSS